MKTKRKKSPSQLKYRKAFLKAERLWKEIAHLRDGDGCQVQRHFPRATYANGESLKHSGVYQVDHCFPRGDHNLFFHPKNGTKVCSCCNAGKSWKTASIEEMIRQIVLNREGGMEFGLMQEIHLSHIPNLNWKDAEWLEKQVIPQLEEYLKELKEEHERN